jgi:TPP-dependent pyruvate/acetoin dehydrogenase alpha subunit
MGQGAVYECLNMAALWSLPLLFVVEDNSYAQTTPKHLAVAGDIPARAAAFGIETDELDTTDVEEIAAAAARAVEHVRATGRPFFLVLHTYRFSPHSKGDDFRDPAEIEGRRALDPLLVAGARLDDEVRASIDEAVERLIAETVEAAEAAPVAGA